MITPTETYAIVKNALLYIDKVLGWKSSMVSEIYLYPLQRDLSKKFCAAIVSISQKGNGTRLFVYTIWICCNPDKTYYIITVGYDPLSLQKKLQKGNKIPCNAVKPALTKFDPQWFMVAEQITVDFVLRFQLTCRVCNDNKPGMKKFINAKDIELSQIGIVNLEPMINRN